MEPAQRESYSFPEDRSVSTWFLLKVLPIGFGIQTERAPGSITTNSGNISGTRYLDTVLLARVHLFRSTS